MDMLSLRFGPSSLPRAYHESQFCLSRTKDRLVYSRDSGSAFQISGAERPTSLVCSRIPKTGLVPCGRQNSSIVEKEEGLGIMRFLRGKNLLITGATGFLAKVLVEKILRVVPDVGKIYVLINETTEDGARQRLSNEIINSDLFRCLRQTQGKLYEAFMMSKLVSVAGNISSPNLGIREDLQDSIAEEVDIIVNSAGSMNFDEMYNTAVAVNTLGPCHLLAFGRRCKELKVFLHVSTAYANGKRNGIIKEIPFHFNDDTVVRGNFNGHDKLPCPIPILDVEEEIRLATGHQQGRESHLANHGLKKLGSERANKYGWQNTYSFTKAMGEMMIDKNLVDIPVVIMRPSIVEGTYKEPFPGWIQGNRSMDPVILSYGKGLLPGFVCGEKTVIDVVPVDIVVNVILAAIVKHGLAGESGINVYHVASSVLNPLLVEELFRLFHVHFSTSHFMDSQRRPIIVSPTKLFNSMDGLLDFINKESSHGSRLAEGTSSNDKTSEKKPEFIRKKSLELAKYLARMYESYLVYQGRFDNSNMEQLMESMSEDEKKTFGFDVRSIDWTDYITNVHIPGLRRYVVKEGNLHSQG